MTRKKEFRTQLSDEEWDLINEIREKNPAIKTAHDVLCLLYTSDAADDGESVDLGGRRIIKKKKK